MTINNRAAMTPKKEYTIIIQGGAKKSITKNIIIIIKLIP